MASSTNYGHVKFQDISCNAPSGTPVIKCDLGCGCCPACGYYNFTCYQCSLVWLCLKRAGYSDCNQYIYMYNCTPYPLMLLKGTFYKNGGSSSGDAYLKSLGMLLTGSCKQLGYINGSYCYMVTCILVAPFKGIPIV